MSHSSLRDTLAELGLELRDQYLRCPEKHADSDIFRKAMRLAEEISYEQFQQPKCFPTKLTEARLYQ